MRKVLSLTLAVAMAMGLMAAASPSASAATSAVIRSGHCSAKSTWKLTLKRDNGKIEADVEVQTPRAGQQWRSRFADNGTVFARVTKTTEADGSFSATRFATNQSGSDLIRVRSLNLSTGELCRASATL